MTTEANETDTELELGQTRRRKPSTAMNLSFFLAGLGQIYCGLLRRGVYHMCAVGAVVVGAGVGCWLGGGRRVGR